ncbi:mucin-associated surface protein (MASP), putative [Trypanosoma cruzi marinkellei]|uniref:Mucin-associated surface protein (MASP), putative n=1 Tax=Trypanosoma cruzi marinkellei TaxID=85056 RepID=K2NPC8_TRYCR|nr:mucin-associated surface protein (MASP), putative [Trypanosoma cruzi marinkellei]
MAMMMTGRVLLVCALCVLWCGIAGGRCDEGVGAPAGGGNVLGYTNNGVSEGLLLNADSGLFYTSIGLLKAVEAGDDNLPEVDETPLEITEVSDPGVAREGTDGGELAGAKGGHGAAGAVTSPPGRGVPGANEGESHLEEIEPQKDEKSTRNSANGKASNSQNQTGHQSVPLSERSATRPGEVLPLSNSDSAQLYKDPLKKGDVVSRDTNVGDIQNVEDLEEATDKDKELKNFKDKTGPETHKVEKKEKVPQTKTSTVQITTSATTQIPEVKLPEGIPAKAGPEEDVSLTGSNDAQKLTHQRHENSSSQTEKTAEAPDPPAAEGVPPQKAQETTTENSMESVTGDSPPESTETFISTSGRSEAQSTENGNDAQQSNPNESHGDLEGGDIHTAPTTGEAAPQTAETAIIARTNNTTNTQNSDGSTVVSHTTSPLLLLLVVACAAAAVVVAA